MSPHLHCTLANGRRSIRRVPALSLMVAVAALGSAAPAAASLAAGGAPTPAQAGCLDTPLTSIAESGVTGSAMVCIGDGGVRAQVATSNLATDNAYTAWFVYIDQPSKCKTQPCTPPDATGEDPVAVVGRMDALVADSSGAGAFEGDFRGLRVSSGSEVHVPIYGHGPVSTDDYRARARQLLTPEDPLLGAPGLGVPAAHPNAGPVAVAIFVIP
jgi:hypothetical protein